MECSTEKTAGGRAGCGDNFRGETRYGHGGDIYRNPVRYDFSVNVNPLGMPEKVRKRLKASVDGWSAYPDPEWKELMDGLCGYHRIPAQWMLCGNGAADLIYRLVWTIKPRRALITAPAFSEYERALNGIGCRIDVCFLRETEDFRLNMEQFASMVTEETDLVFLCNPNNPNGLAVPRQDVLDLADVCREKHAYLIVDECFCELLEKPEKYSVMSSVEGRPGLVVLRAFTKTYAMAGLRLGYVACENIDLLEEMRRNSQPWNISLPAQQAGAEALKEKEYLAQARSMIAGERTRLMQELKVLGLRVYPSDANYLLFQYPEEKENRNPEKEASLTSEGTLWERCIKQGVLIRDCSNYRGLGPGYYRVCVRRPWENEVLVQVLKAALSD